VEIDENHEVYAHPVCLKKAAPRLNQSRSIISEYTSVLGNLSAIQSRALLQDRAPVNFNHLFFNILMLDYELTFLEFDRYIHCITTELRGQMTSFISKAKFTVRGNCTVSDSSKPNA